MENNERPKLKKAFTLAWSIWAAAFVVIEGIALYIGTKGDTLSEHVWFLRSKWGTGIMAAIFGGLFIWLLYHFLFEGPKG